MLVGNKIKKFRKEQNLTQKELALKANISRSYLADLESDRYNPSIDTLSCISQALSINIKDFFEDEEFSNTETMNVMRNTLLRELETYLEDKTITQKKTDLLKKYIEALFT